MQTADIFNNPFAMMTHPAEVLQAIGQSDHLSELQRHVCRPLDKPVNLMRVGGGFIDYPMMMEMDSEFGNDM
jgi:hypothetical protein